MALRPDPGRIRSPISPISAHERPDVFARAADVPRAEGLPQLPADRRDRRDSFDSIACIGSPTTATRLHVAYDDALAPARRSRAVVPPGVAAGHERPGGLTAEAAAEHLALRPGIPVVVGTPDVHSAAIGAGTTADFAAHLYIGTSSWLTCHVPFKKTDVTHSIASLPAAIPDRYLVANEQETAGKALEWLSQLLYPDAARIAGVYAEMNEIAAGVPAGSGGVIFTPWLFGERTPVEDSTLRAGFFNQSLEIGRAEMIRSVFEGVAFNTRWLLGYVETFVGVELDPIVMVGGGARSDLWCQIHADVLGKDHPPGRGSSHGERPGRRPPRPRRAGPRLVGRDIPSWCRWPPPITPNRDNGGGL